MDERFKFFLENCKVQAKHWIENYEKAKKLDPTSSEFRISAEVCNNIEKQIEKHMSTIHSMILTFNKDPNILPDCTKEDILQAQLSLDEVISKLKEHGVNFTFTRDKVFDMNSTHTN